MGGTEFPSIDIRVELRRQGLTQQALASALGVDASTLTRIMRGQRRPPGGFAARARAAIARLARAEHAAADARARSLAADTEGGDTGDAHHQ